MKNCLAKPTNDKFKNLFLDTNLITVGETSEEFQFYTLLSSPPSSLACETTDNTLSISWSDPTVGLVAGTDYTYSFSLMESMFSQYLLVAIGLSGIYKVKQKLGVTFNSDKLGGIDFTKFSKLTMCSAGAGWCNGLGFLLGTAHSQF